MRDSAQQQVRENALRAVSSRLGEPVEAGAFFKVRLNVDVAPTPEMARDRRALMPPAVSVAGASGAFVFRLVNKVKWARRHRTPLSYVFLAVTANVIAAVTLEFGRGVSVRDVPWQQPRKGTAARRSDTWSIEIDVDVDGPIIFEAVDYESSTKALLDLVAPAT